MSSAGAPPNDYLHVQRDPDYERRAAEEAAFYDQPRNLNIDTEMPVADAYHNECFTGDPNLPWYETIPKYGAFHQGCALGSGGAKQRARILEQNSDLHLKVYDISKESLVLMKRELDERFPGRVEIETVDLNFVEFKENSFDLVISSGCVHHLSNLEHIAAQINRSLTPQGYFFLQDYVGEARFQFSDEKKQLFEEAFAAARRRHRPLRHWRAVWPDLDNWPHSPFEAIRSDETLDVFRRYLTEVEVRTTGAVVDLTMFVLPPRPLGRPGNLVDAAKRRLAALKSKLTGGAMNLADGRALLAADLLPLDREISSAGSLRPMSAFAVYRKRVP